MHCLSCREHREPWLFSFMCKSCTEAIFSAARIQSRTLVPRGKNGPPLDGRAWKLHAKADELDLWGDSGQ